MSQLEELLLDGNKIKQLPDFFGVFSRLRYLDCGFNQLELVSPELGRCTNLLDLTLSSNDLKVIKSGQTGKNKIHFENISSILYYTGSARGPREPHQAAHAQAG